MISHSDLFTSFFASFGVCGLILRALVLTLTLHGLIFQMRPFSKWNRRERLTICAHHFGNGSSCGNTRTPKLLAFHWTSWDILRTWNDTYIIYIYIYQLYTNYIPVLGSNMCFILVLLPSFTHRVISASRRSRSQTPGRQQPKISAPSDSIPICSMYGIFTYIWVFLGANVGKYSIHGAYGNSF